jgi:hypothetical protein
MRRRRLAGVTLAALLSGCNGLGDLGPGGRTATPFGGGAGGSDETGRRAGETAPTAESGTVAPYQPAEGDPLDRPAGILLRNATTRSRYATVVVRDGDRDVSVHSTELDPAATVELPALVAAAGRYRVAVETAGGRRGTTDWRAAPPVANLAIDLRPGVRFRRHASCPPDCASLSTLRTRSAVGRATGDGEGDDTGGGGSSDGVATVVLDNGTDRERVATVRAVGRGETLLDGDFRVPRRARLDVRLRRWVSYRITVEVDGWPAVTRWSTGSMPRLVVDVGDDDGPTFRCRDVLRDLVVENRDRRRRVVSVRVLAGAEVALERRFELAPDGRETLPSAVPPGSSYEVLVESSEGFRERYAWAVCPPVGPIRVVAVEGGEIRVAVRA